MFDEAGLPHAQRRDLVPNSRQALILSELARDRGLLDALHPRLFDAYWARGLDIGSAAILLAEGREVGLSDEEMSAAWADPAYTERVAAETERAIELGVSGVPAWVIDDRVLIPGAQPHEVFDQVMGRLGHQGFAS